MIIEGLTFDSGAFPKASTSLGIGHAKNITVRNCIFKNQYSLLPNSHYIEINASQHVLVDGCLFEPEYHCSNKISDKTKWDNVYAEYINLDRASDNSYGAAGYYAWDNTEPDDIEITRCRFESFPSDYWSHPENYPEPNGSIRTAANVFYGSAIDGHADYGETCAGNRARRRQMSVFMTTYFSGILTVQSSVIQIRGTEVCYVRSTGSAAARSAHKILDNRAGKTYNNTLRYYRKDGAQ